MTLLELYQSDKAIMTSMRQIMLARSRMQYKRERMRSKLRELKSPCVNFSMAELRELQYFLHPQDERRKVSK